MHWWLQDFEMISSRCTVRTPSHPTSYFMWNLLKAGKFFDISKYICIHFLLTGWQKLHGSTGGTRRKVWTRTKILKPKHMLFCRKLRFVAIYALFGDLWPKKVPFWVKNSVSWARSALLHGIYCIFNKAKFANL